jgi:hypothetical protein
LISLERVTDVNGCITLQKSRQAMFKYLTDFGFDTSNNHSGVEGKKTQSEDFKDITFGPKKDSVKLLWTLLIYLFLALGLFARPLVNTVSDVSQGLNPEKLRWDILLTSLIVALAMLSPLLKIISRVNYGQLSWQHCLSAFSISFFSDLTFKFILDHFTGLLGINK